MLNNQINYKHYTVEVTAPDGVKLIGEIKYWSKDFEIRLTYPFSAYGCNSHLQFSIPAIYATTEAPRKGIHYINLTERAETVLLALYDKKKPELNASDVQRLIGEDYFENNKALFDVCCREWNISEIDKVILEELI